MKEYTNEGCVALVGAAFKKCLNKTNRRDEIEATISFVTNGCLFDLYCLETNQDREKLKNLVLIRNHKFLKDL